MIAIGTDQIREVFAGGMGVKDVYVGDQLVYARPGGYIYLELSTNESAKENTNG